MLSIEYINLDKIRAKFGKVTASMEKEVGQAIGKSMEMVATESKRLAPIKHGILRSSIGSSAHPQGIFRQERLTGYVGTNVEYAWRQHEELTWHHPLGGEAKYMEKGARNAKDYVEKTMKGAIDTVVKGLAN